MRNGTKTGCFLPVFAALLFVVWLSWFGVKARQLTLDMRCDNAAYADWMVATWGVRALDAEDRQRYRRNLEVCWQEGHYESNPNFAHWVDAAKEKRGEP